MADPCSFANVQECVCSKISWFVKVSFENKWFECKADLTFDIVKDGVQNLILDSRDLAISKVKTKDTNCELPFTTREAHQAFGSALEIQLPQSFSNGSKLEISIEYKTSPTASAVQWLEPEQTAGKKHPYMFTQCQAIHARSIIPCQDTPEVKTPYEAQVSVPKNLVAVMSAEGCWEETDPQNPHQKIFKFQQKVAIPSYLIALAVGDLLSKKIGPRSRVWTEVEMLEKSAFEFAEVETMIATAESLVGPYVWGIYDLLVLPPSFPYGGMENPCLTFVTPTLLAGDRSLATVLIHEISHSWTGNLVTNVNWEHFWLNEGFTRFLERKILGRMKGNQLSQLSYLGGWKTLMDSVNKFGKDNPLTALKVVLKDVDPDDAFSSVPYEKGSCFLFYLEQLLGGPAKGTIVDGCLKRPTFGRSALGVADTDGQDLVSLSVPGYAVLANSCPLLPLPWYLEKFEPFFRSYIEKYKHKTVTTDEWKDYLFEYFKDQTDKLSSVDWDGWLNKPGMPPVNVIDRRTAPQFEDHISSHFLICYDTSLADACKNLSEQWLKADVDDLANFGESDIEGFTSPQITEFLQELLTEKPLPVSHLEAMQRAYDLNKFKNAEIRFRWLRLCVRSGWEKSFDLTITFLLEQGRMKFVRPLYEEMFKCEKSRDLAVTTFKKNRHIYHPIAAEMIAKDLKLV